MKIKKKINAKRSNKFTDSERLEWILERFLDYLFPGASYRKLTKHEWKKVRQDIDENMYLSLFAHGTPEDIAKMLKSGKIPI